MTTSSGRARSRSRPRRHRLNEVVNDFVAFNDATTTKISVASNGVSGQTVIRKSDECRNTRPSTNPLP